MMKLFIVGLILVSTSLSHAAIPGKGYVPARQTILALIAMAPENRKAALYQQPESVYQGLMSLAFDKKEKITRTKR